MANQMLKSIFSNARPTEDIGVGGYAIYGGYVQDQETNQKLKGTQKYKAFSDALVNTAIVAAGVRYFINLVGGAGWTFKPADESDKAAQIAARIEKGFDEMNTPFVRVIRRASMYRFNGFSMAEWTAKKFSDGFIGFKNIEPRPNVTIERWERDPDSGEIIGVYQRNPQNGREIPLPRNKLLYVVDDALNDSPEGIGLLRHVVPHSDKLKIYQSLEAHGFTTDLRGIPIARAPIQALEQKVKDGTLTKEEKGAALQGLKDFITSHNRSPETGILLDSTTYRTTDDKNTPSSIFKWSVELLKGSSTALPEIGKAIVRIHHDIARILGVEQLLLGADSKGSHALSRDKTNIFFLIVNSSLHEIAKSMEQDLVSRIMLLNGWPTELAPSLIPEPVKFMDVEQVTAALENLARAGALVTEGDPVINFVRELLGAPLLDSMDAAADAAVTHSSDNPANLENMPGTDGEGA